MPIRPIDPQGVLHKVSELQRTTTTVREQQQGVQHHFFAELEQITDRQQLTVRQTDESAEGQLSRDRRGSQGRQHSDQRQAGQKNDNPVSDGVRGTRLDIKV